MKPPDDIKVYCELCPTTSLGMEAAVEHLRRVHPDRFEEPERWPDGSLVLHAPDIEPADIIGGAS